MAVVASLLLASPRSSDVPETEAPHRADMSSIPPRTAHIVGRRWGWGCDVRGRDGRGWDLVSLGIANGRWSFINCSPSIGVVDTGLSQLGRSQGQRGWPSMAKLDTRGSAAGCHPPTLPLPPPVPGIPGCPDSAKFSASSKGIVALKMGPFTPFPWRSWCNCSRHGREVVVLSSKSRESKWCGWWWSWRWRWRWHRSTCRGWRRASCLLPRVRWGGVWSSSRWQHPWRAGSGGGISTILLTTEVVSVGHSGRLSRRSFLIALPGEKTLSMTSINPSIRQSVRAMPCNSAVRYGSASQHRIDPPRFHPLRFLMRVTNGGLPGHCQEQSSSLDEACEAWTWPPISSHHQPSTPPRATEPPSQDDVTPRAPSRDPVLSRLNLGGGNQTQGRCCSCPPEMSAWSAFSVVPCSPSRLPSSGPLLPLDLLLPSPSIPSTVLFFCSFPPLPGIEPVTRLPTTLLWL